MVPDSQEKNVPRYWCANFNPDDQAEARLEYGFMNNLWLMQYQYGQQKQGPVTNNWENAKRVEPGDILVAYVSQPARFFGIGRVRGPRLPADHTDTIQRTLKQHEHRFTDGIVHYQDGPAFYENLTNGNGFDGAWGQRLDVEKWNFVNGAGMPAPDGFGQQMRGFARAALVEISPEYFGTIERELRMHANRLELVLDDAERVLENIPQIILQGPPGTGKTYAAKRLAANILGIPHEAVDKEEAENNGQFHDARFANNHFDNCWELVQFHPSYGYEDFVRGIQAKAAGNNINYEVVPRVLDKLARHHRQGAHRKTVLVIDEINRANLAQVLGELIYALEYRGSEVETPYEIDGSGTIAVPRRGFFVIGTMNTADRSIGRIDYAVRRRFAFLQINPDRSVIDAQPSMIPDSDKRWAGQLFDAVKNLFAREGLGPLYLAPEFHPDEVQVGHTYFLGSHNVVRSKFVYQVYPLLREYYKDGMLLREDGKIELVLPGNIGIDLANAIDTTALLSVLENSWRAVDAPDSR